MATTRKRKIQPEDEFETLEDTFDSIDAVGNSKEELEEEIEALLNSDKQEVKNPVEVEEVIETAPPSKPKKKGRSSWRPGKPLTIPPEWKHPDFVYRWCNTDDLQKGNISTKLNEGWEIDYQLTKKMRSRFAGKNPDLDKATNLDTTTQYKGQIVMRMHKDTKESRDEYFRNLRKGQIKQSKSRFNQETGGRAYTPKGY